MNTCWSGETFIGFLSKDESHSTLSSNNSPLRTNKGDGKGTRRSRIIPIARLFQRRLLWLSGLAKKFMNGQNIDLLAPFESNEGGAEDVCIHDV